MIAHRKLSYDGGAADHARSSLIPKLRKKVRHRRLEMSDKLLLRKRAVIETINDQLQNFSQIERSRYRSPINFLVNLITGLIASCHQPKKPSLGQRPFALKQP
jgi:Transposase DDE domain